MGERHFPTISFKLRPLQMTVRVNISLRVLVFGLVGVVVLFSVLESAHAAARKTSKPPKRIAVLGEAETAWLKAPFLQMLKAFFTTEGELYELAPGKIRPLQLVHRSEQPVFEFLRGGNGNAKENNGFRQGDRFMLTAGDMGEEPQVSGNGTQLEAIKSPIVALMRQGGAKDAVDGTQTATKGEFINIGTVEGVLPLGRYEQNDLYKPIRNEVLSVLVPADRSYLRLSRSIGLVVLVTFASTVTYLSTKYDHGPLLPPDSDSPSSMPDPDEQPPETPPDPEQPKPEDSISHPEDLPTPDQPAPEQPTEQPGPVSEQPVQSPNSDRPTLSDLGIGAVGAMVTLPRVRSHSVTVDRRGRARIVVSCPKTAKRSCTGKVALQAKQTKRARRSSALAALFAGAAARPAKPVRLTDTVSISLQPGQRRIVRLRLNGKGRDLMRKRSRPCTAVVKLTTATGALERQYALKLKSPTHR
jgi:hypothetical protein